ncbi:MAG TPA: SPOR domain-containing protein [Burkholderiales bacterium]|nr:SPOR domain-containing protein [Burkholderiales bacterium]
MLIRAGIAALLIAAAMPLQAAPDAMVEGVQLPAWLIRDGQREPLTAGTELKARDEIATGSNSRLLLRLGDGSLVKLGENGWLQIAELAQRQAKNFLSATLKVFAGAFRYTTAPEPAADSEVTVQFTTLIARFNAADIWGKKLSDHQVLVLIDGKVSVARVAESSASPPLDMKDALTFLQAPRSGAGKIEPVQIEQLKIWAAETEISEGQGAIRRGGLWKLNLAKYANQIQALSLYDSLRREGYPALIQQEPREEGPAYLVRIAGFPSELEANLLGARLKQINPRLEPIASLQ